MHDLYVCTNPCCRRYRDDYAEAMKIINTERIPVGKLLISKNGDRVCAFCRKTLGWNIEPCIYCGTEFGEIQAAAPEDPPIVPVECAVCGWINGSNATSCAQCTVNIHHSS